MLRHAAALVLANKGTDTRTLQAYLGHRSIQSTVRYTELAPSRLTCGAETRARPPPTLPDSVRLFDPAGMLASWGGLAQEKGAGDARVPLVEDTNRPTGHGRIRPIPFHQ